jgi:uncharacterized protein YmfQ (DUF2313 family)
MAFVDVEALNEIEAESPQLLMSVTDISATPKVLRQFPLGPYFDRTTGWLPATARGIARFLSRLWERRTAFVRNMDPRTADELLEDYERAFALDQEDETDEDRRDAILTKMRARGGVTAADIQQAAIDFGYLDAVVTDAANPLDTESLADDFLMDTEWKLTLLLTAASQGVARDTLLEELILSLSDPRNSLLHAGWYAIFDFT